MGTLTFIPWRSSTTVLTADLTEEPDGIPYQDAASWFAKQTETRIYRGQEDSTLPIRSTLARYKPAGTDLEVAGKRMLEHFRLDGPFRDDDLRSSILDWRDPKSDPNLDPHQLMVRWEMLAQHYGVPTRLIDWSDSFHTALFFAFGGWSSINIKAPKRPCVWCLDPLKVEEGGIALRKTKAGEPNATLEDYLKYDDAVHVIPREQSVNSRQRAQRGWFAHMRSSFVPLEDYFEANSDSFAKGTLIRIPLRSDQQEGVLRMLADAHTTAAHIRGDVEGVAKDAVNKFLRFKFELDI